MLQFAPDPPDPVHAGEGLELVEQVITCAVGSQYYGVDIRAVREIIGWTGATRLPHAPAFLRGVINRDGAILPVIDLRARFGLGLTEAGKTHIVMVVAVDNRLFGLLVDGVGDIMTLPVADVRAVAEMERPIDGRWLSGLALWSGGLLGLLALDRLFDSQPS